MARKGLNVEAVVAAAADLAEKIGFSNLNLLDLAGVLEIKSASLYNHIANLAAQVVSTGRFIAQSILASTLQGNTT